MSIKLFDWIEAIDDVMAHAPFGVKVIATREALAYRFIGTGVLEEPANDPSRVYVMSNEPCDSRYGRARLTAQCPVHREPLRADGANQGDDELGPRNERTRQCAQ